MLAEFLISTTVRAAMKAPRNMPIKPSNLLIPLKPEGHLGKLVLAVCSGICIFCQINVETLGVLGIVPISGAEEFDGQGVVEKGMELRKVEVRPDLEVYKDQFVGVEVVQGGVHFSKCPIIVHW